MINVCIHGHFYQPPRENPWTGEIELQEGAKPYHDWNERIYHECYKHNSEAQIVNEKGETVQRENNYERINFNFGPPLLEWIKRKHPDTYIKIIDDDKTSFAAHNGHGNAIAMCYNHMIMPLANFNDKITQVKWGFADFKYHFERGSEGIWLPETACNQETIEVLINEGVKYIILDPSQAASIRKTGVEEWTDVNSGGLDPGLNYKCYSHINKNRFINIFFYDGPLSKTMAFDDVLFNSQNLLNKINQAVIVNSENERLISAATDGETFGHHKKFADRTLAHFLKVLAPLNNINILNFGEYLEKHPPQYEVIIKPGENGEGTSWSCPHGVKRCKDDCGCGGGDSWNQKWRKPLRETLEWLRDQLIVIYNQHGALYFKDVWKARNEYINVIVNDTPESRLKFISENSNRSLTSNESETYFRLLEMQKYAMFMFTSCAWFFSEISGIETVKILEYAARAIELANDISGIDLEGEFLKKLSEAKSNIKEYVDGRNIYLKMVKQIKT